MNYKNKNWLHEKYCEEKLSIRKIAALCNVTPQAIHYNLKKYNIKRRTISKALIGRTISDEHKEKIVKNIIAANTRKSIEGVSEKEKKRLKEIRKLRKNYVHSDETKEKMRHSALGKKMSLEARKKMSEAKKELFSNPEKHPLYGTERKDIQGENHPNWNGGITPLYKSIRETREYKNWRQACFERDDYTCVFCKKRGGNLHVDHIKTYASIIKKNNLQTVVEAKNCDELWDIGNGRTLCIACHRKTDTYGRSEKMKKECVRKEK